MTVWIRGRRALAAAALLLLASAGTASAQGLLSGSNPDLRETRFTGLGFAVTIPNSLSGVAAFHTFPSIGWGVFVTSRFVVETPADEPNFEESITVPEAFAFQDRPVGDRDVVYMIGGGILRPVNETFALYVGAGYAWERTYWEFEDLSGTRGSFGYYWVEDERVEKSGMNYTGGALLQLNQHVFFQGGFDTFPKGVSMAGFLAMPW